MEIFFAGISFLILLISLSLNISMSKKINKIDSKFEPLYRKNDEIVNELFCDIEGLEKAVVLLSKKLESIPNIIQEDIHRSSMSLREHFEPMKSIKPNNFDSLREAFKGPVRVDNERT